jgi:hypothetical protein
MERTEQGLKSKSAPDSEGAVQRPTAKNATDDGEDRTGTDREERTRRLGGPNRDRPRRTHPTMGRTEQRQTAKSATDDWEDRTATDR